MEANKRKAGRRQAKQVGKQEKDKQTKRKEKRAA